MPSIIEWKYIYNTHWQASDFARLFLSATGGSLSVGRVVLRSDALASALISDILLSHNVAATDLS